jgi:N-acetylglucosaminyldiphosphoundecaprenol N-acetyl-beta-D-mannosaminyltransferase
MIADLANPVQSSDVRFPVLSVKINSITRAIVFQKIHDWIQDHDRQYVNVCSVQTILDCYDSAELTRIINSSGMAVPDGMPLVWIGKYFKHPMERIYGPDLLLDICNKGQEFGFKHYFYGGGPGIPEKMSQKLKSLYPKIKIAGTCSPPFRELTREEDLADAAMINDSNADIVWCGLGTPKQDYWMDRMRPLLKAPVLIAVGAAFDIHAGNLRQAPHWMRRTGLEWSFRLMMEPRRLWRRYLLGNPRFIRLIVKQLYTSHFTRQ